MTFLKVIKGFVVSLHYEYGFLSARLHKFGIQLYHPTIEIFKFNGVRGGEYHFNFNTKVTIKALQGYGFCLAIVVLGFGLSLAFGSI